MSIRSKDEEDPFDSQLRISLKKGYSSRGNREVTITGESKFYETHYGRFHWLQGSIEIRLYSTRILGIDFEKRRVTDYQIGKHHYGRSMTTQQNIKGWRDALWRAFPLVLPGWLKWEYDTWTERQHADTRYTRFAERMPWRVRDSNGVIWCEWEKFDHQLAGLYDAGNIFLREDQNHRYFDYDWDDQGRWARKFINADAERRWRQRERRRELSKCVSGTP